MGYGKGMLTLSLFALCETFVGCMLKISNTILLLSYLFLDLGIWNIKFVFGLFLDIIYLFLKLVLESNLSWKQ